MDANLITSTIGTVAFPAAVAVFLLWQGKLFLEKMLVSLDKQADAMNKQADALNKLTMVIELLKAQKEG
jgi:hypothetical protein